MWFSKEEGLGVNGYKLRECVLQAIDKDFDGDLEIELFSRYQQIPGEEVCWIEVYPAGHNHRDGDSGKIYKLSKEIEIDMILPKQTV